MTSSSRSEGSPSRGRRVKVVFVCGWGRSGTTILDRCLGQAEGFVSCGEIRYVWDRGLLDDELCSCGEPFRQCPLWREVMRGYLESSAAQLRGIVTARDGFRSRECLRAPVPAERRWRPELATYASHLETIIGRISRVSGARVVIDSSKFPSHGYALEAIGVRLHVLHVVRDPRATAHSWRRRKLYQRGPKGSRYMERKGTLQNAVYWLVWNRTIERLWASRPEIPYRMVRYEDFVADPRGVLRAVLSMLGEEDGLHFFRSSHEVDLLPGHLVGGNPARFRSGEVGLFLDDAWRTGLPAGNRLLTTLATYPALRRCGYLDSKPHPTTGKPEHAETR